MASGYSRTSAGQRHHRIAGTLADAADAGRGVTVEYRRDLRRRRSPRGVLGRLPVGVVGAALDVVDLLAIEFERNAQFDQRLHLALPGDDAVARRGDVAQMTGADRRQARRRPGPCTSTTRRPAR